LRAQATGNALLVPRPLQESYWTTVAIVIAVLSPHIVVSTGFFLLGRHQAADLHTTKVALQVAEGFADAGYAFGALLAGDLIQRLPQRRLFFACSGPLVAGFLLSATAPGIVQYASGRVLQGLATGLLLVVAVPPLVQRFPPARMPQTTAMINIGFFGAVCVGPVLAGAVATGHAWRWFLGGLGGVVLLGIVLAVFALPTQEPPNPDLRFDAIAVGLGLGSTVLSFLAVSRLQAIPFASPFFVALLTAGVVALLALLLIEYHRDEPLSPVKPLSSAIPTIGTLAATVGGGAFVALVLLLETLLTKTVKASPGAVALDFLPQVLGVVVAALALGVLVRTRYLPHLTLFGMLALIAAAVVLAPADGSSRILVLVVTGLLGLGAGASVSPGLWIAGMSLPVAVVGRTFALVELVRSLGDFVLAPVLQKVAVVYGRTSPLHGIHVAVWATLALAVAGTAVGVALWFASDATAQQPDLEAWLEEGENALHSPPPLARLRGLEQPV
jgi:predicted MFS family arabinose efflux permease